MTRPALAVAVLALVVGYVLNIWIVPAAMTAFREYQFEIRNRMAAFLLQDGVFTAVADDLTVYIRKRDTDGNLFGVLVDDQRDPNQPATILFRAGAHRRRAERAAGRAVQRQPPGDRPAHRAA